MKICRPAPDARPGDPLMLACVADGLAGRSGRWAASWSPRYGAAPVLAPTAGVGLFAAAALDAGSCNAVR